MSDSEQEKQAIFLNDIYEEITFNENQVKNLTFFAMNWLLNIRNKAKEWRNEPNEYKCIMIEDMIYHYAEDEEFQSPLMDNLKLICAQLHTTSQ